MKTAAEIFSALGERFESFGRDDASRNIIAEATARNGWFTAEDILYAVDALRAEMLQEEKLSAWLSAYDFSGKTQKRVAIIMAGNIPLVGFFDLLCVLASGHAALVKPSNKDSVLMRYVIDALRDIEPRIPIDSYSDGCEIDAIIATGSNNTKRYFSSEFADKPSLLRGNRHSAAVLSGDESAAELDGLQSDIFRYSGLGCRNVSLLLVPRGYVPNIGAVPVNRKYAGNYRQTKALLTMTRQKFTDNSICLLTESDQFPASLSTISYFEYGSLSEAEEWLTAHDDELQCVVSNCINHPRRVAFGEAQRPRLTDYPDDNDVMRFLQSI